MQIKVVDTSKKREFEEQVNELLAGGWKLYGFPSFIAVPQQDDFSGSGCLRAWVEYGYTQCLIKE